MMLPACQSLKLRFDRGVLYILFNRPQQKNALSLQMVNELRSVLSVVDGDVQCRSVVLRGSGGTFCAGGDIGDMMAARMAKEESEAEFRRLNRCFGHLINQLDRLSQTVISVVEGAAMGGGFGLVCVSDIVLADRSAVMALPETSLGLIPAQIAPFLVRRLGLMKARRLALTGARLRGQELKEEGLVDVILESKEALDSELLDTLKKVLRCAPMANATTKHLLNQVGSISEEALLDQGAELFATAILSSEGIEGTMAFINKRAANWFKEWSS